MVKIASNNSLAKQGGADSAPIIRQPATHISAGPNHTLLLDRDGNVYGFGSNQRGQLGLGPDDLGRHSTPTKLNLRGIVQVSSGHSNTVFLDSIGNVYTSGALSSRIYPTRITQFIADGRRIRKPKIVQVSAGYSHMVLLDDGGRVYTFGFHHCGQLGHDVRDDDHTPRCSVPTRVVDGLSDKRMVQVLASEYKTLVLDQDGNVYMWGCHQGDVMREPMPPTMITEFIADGRSIKQPKIVQFSAARDHTLLLDDRGRVYTFGLSYGGKLGHGRPKRNWREWMDDNMGKFPGLDKDKPTMITKFIANGRSIKQPEIIQVTSGTYHNVLLDQDGRIYTFGGGLIPNANGGPHGYDKPTRVEGVLGSKYIVQISAGELHTVVLDYKGNVYTFGDNRYGQLGHGDQVSRPLPTKVEGVQNIGSSPASLGLVKWADPKQTPNCGPGPCSKPKAPGEGERGRGRGRGLDIDKNIS